MKFADSKALAHLNVSLLNLLGEASQPPQEPDQIAAQKEWLHWNKFNGSAHQEKKQVKQAPIQALTEWLHCNKALGKQTKNPAKPPFRP